jgi:hypothetical protein
MYRDAKLGSTNSQNNAGIDHPSNTGEGGISTPHVKPRLNVHNWVKAIYNLPAPLRNILHQAQTCNLHHKKDE